MEINGDRRQIDAALRRKTDAAAQVAAKVAAPATPSAADGGRESQTDSFDAASISRFVGILKNMNPVDLHRVDELRARISDGSYRADSGDLADSLANMLGDGPAPKG